MIRFVTIRAMLTVVALATAVMVLFVGVTFLDDRSAAYCAGQYELTVDVDSDLAGGIREVAYVGVSNAKTADSMSPEIDSFLDSMNREPAVPFVVQVGFSYRESMLGRTWGHVQEYAELIVVLIRNDGSRGVHRLPVPHRNESRRIFVTLGNAQ